MILKLLNVKRSAKLPAVFHEKLEVGVVLVRILVGKIANLLSRLNAFNRREKSGAQLWETHG